MIPAHLPNPINQGLLEAVSQKASVTVGRSEQNDVQVLDPKVSRFHCKIEKTVRGLMLIDLSSKNGTYVNGVKINNALLEPGDVLRLGDNTLTMSSEGTQSLTPQGNQQTKGGLPWVPAPEVRTQEINPKYTGTSVNDRQNTGEAAKNKTAFAVTTISNIGETLFKNKIYLASIIILFVGLIGFLSLSFITEDTTQASSISNIASKPQAPPEGEITEKPAISEEDQEKATQIAREAGVALDAGDFKLAMSQYRQALSLDSGNLLAKEGIEKTNGYIENLAKICFNSGQRELQSFNYQTALKEFEKVVLLLKNNQDHELYIKAAQNIAQAQLKVNE
jgi:pSer/pThr/pTyr-binding forkhead associated (FHA) protein